MDNVQIVRLRNGEDVVAEISTSSQLVMEIKNPMTLFYKRLPEGKMVVLMNPWLPVELIESNVIRINTIEVLGIVKPKQSMLNYYNKAVKEVMDYVEETSDVVDQSLSDVSFEFSDSDELDTEEDLEEESFKEEVVPKGKILH